MIDTRRKLHVVASAEVITLCPEDQLSFDEWREEEAEVERCKAEQRQIEALHGQHADPVGAMIGWLDWEVEAFLVRKYSNEALDFRLSLQERAAAPSTP